MTSWSTDELARIARASELRVAGQRKNGELRRLTTVWHVVVNGALYIRSVYGSEGAWYRGVRTTGAGRIESGGVAEDAVFVPDADRDDEIDAAYRQKYGTGAPVQAITAAGARATTLRVEPARAA